MAKLADAADLKSAGPKGLWGFDSPSRHQLSLTARPLTQSRNSALAFSIPRTVLFLRDCRHGHWAAVVTILLKRDYGDYGDYSDSRAPDHPSRVPGAPLSS